MRKLLSANFRRLWKNPVFWIAFIGMLCASILFTCMTYRTSLQRPADEALYLEDVLFNLLPMMAFVCAVVVTLFLGTEYEEHTIRNKLIVGHTRRQVYYSNYITCLAASEAILGVVLLSSGLLGYVFFRETMLGWQQIAFLILCCFLLTAVFSAMCTGFAMNISSRAFDLVITLGFILCLLCLASYVEGALLEGEMTYSGVSFTENGVEYGDLVENPAYVGGPARTALELLYDLLPTGQAIQMNNSEFERCARWPVLSAVMLIVSTVLGWISFRKRDIR